MSKTLVCLIFTVALFSSCGYYSKKEKLAAYTQISSINDTLDKMTREWHHLLSNAVSKKNYAALMPYRTEIGRFLSRSRSAVGNLKFTKVSENLIDSEEVFLANQANVVAEFYPGFEAYNEATPIETLQDQSKLIANDLNSEMSMNAAMKRSLAWFAKKNDLK